AIGLLRLRGFKGSQTFSGAATVLGYAGMAATAVGLLVVYNPLSTGEPILGGLFLNSLSFGLLLPALTYGALAFAARSHRPRPYVYGAALVGALLAATWINLTVRHAFHPIALDEGPTTDTELYVYSAIWLLVGLLVLGAGLWSGLRILRLASGVILVVVVAKVFLVDMANLTGVLRALSFIGLGIVLIGIGLVYQRLLRKPPSEAGPEADGTEPSQHGDTA
ncbi:MAG: DUF2339 domain-containing protein, partial [Pseudomonadota bacterium]